MEIASEIAEAISRAIYTYEFDRYGLAKAASQQRAFADAALRKFEMRLEGASNDASAFPRV